MIGQLLTGRYLILENLGTGGFSEIYLARDKYLPHHPLCVVKRLALSSENLSPHLVSPEMARQFFETEVRILNHLGRQHPQIPALYACCHEEDQSYLVQEYIEGENLALWLTQERQLSQDGAIALLLEVLPILEYLHEHGIIHRDIKPSHLIRRHQDGRIVLIDFGAACLVRHAEPDRSHPIALGTPGYMPSEQQMGTAYFSSDLYALGMTVIHLLTGTDPRDFQVNPISGELDWQDYWQQEQPLDPRLADILDRMVRQRADDRYAQATEVLKALQVFPMARRHSPRSRRWLGQWRWEGWPSLRQRLKPALKPALITVAVGVVGGGLLQVHRDHTQFLLAWFESHFRQPDIHLTLINDRVLQSRVDQMLISPDDRLLVTAIPDGSLRLWSLPDMVPIGSLEGHDGSITALDMSRDGQLLVSGGSDRTLRLWQTQAEAPLQVFRGHERAVTAVALSPDQQTVASGAEDGSLYLWDVQSGELLQTLKLPQSSITAVTYGSNPDQIMTASSDRQIQIWNLRSSTIERTFAGHTADIAALQVADDRTLISFGDDRILVWDLDREELVQALSEDAAQPITAFGDRQTLVTVNAQGNIRTWALQAGRLVAQDRGQLNPIWNVALSANHDYLVSWSPDRRLQVWHLQER